MKKLIFALASLAMFTGCVAVSEDTYVIEQDNDTYYTKTYTKSGDCISFTDENEHSVTLCGSYRIVQPKKN